MTAFTRRPELLNPDLGVERVVAGDGLHKFDIRKAIDGNDAVIAIVGGKSDVAGVMRNIIGRMHEGEGCRRLVFVSSYLLEAKRPLFVASVARWLFRRELAELRKAEAVILQCGLDWTIVRPTQLNDQPAAGKVRYQQAGQDFTTGPYQISRADLASVLIDAAEAPLHNQAVMYVTGSK